VARQDIPEHMDIPAGLYHLRPLKSGTRWKESGTTFYYVSYQIILVISRAIKFKVGRVALGPNETTFY
jgi:hypothetical protein